MPILMKRVRQLANGHLPTPKGAVMDCKSTKPSHMSSQIHSITIMRFTIAILALLVASSSASLRGNKRDATPQEITDIVRRELQQLGTYRRVLGRNNENPGQGMDCDALNYEEMAKAVGLDPLDYAPIMYADCLKQTLGAANRSDGSCLPNNDEQIVSWLENMSDEARGCSTTEECRKGCNDADPACSGAYCFVHFGASYCAVSSSGTNQVQLCAEEDTNGDIGV